MPTEEASQELQAEYDRLELAAEEFVRRMLHAEALVEELGGNLADGPAAFARKVQRERLAAGLEGPPMPEGDAAG